MAHDQDHQVRHCVGVSMVVGVVEGRFELFFLLMRTRPCNIRRRCQMADAVCGVPSLPACLQAAIDRSHAEEADSRYSASAIRCRRGHGVILPEPSGSKGWNGLYYILGDGDVFPLLLRREREETVSPQAGESVARQRNKTCPFKDR